LVFVVATIWLARGLRDGRLRLEFGPLCVPLALFVLLAGVSLTTASSLMHSVKEVLKWSALLMVYFLVTNMVRSRRQAFVLLTTIFLAASTEALIGYYQFFAKAGPDGFITDSFMRAFGTFGQPNPFAGYLTLSVTIAFSLVMYSFKIWSARDIKLSGFSRFFVVLGWLTFGACFIAIVMSLSRGAWIGLAAGLAVIAGLSSRRALSLMILLVILLGIFLAMGLMDVLPAQISARVNDAMGYFGIFDPTTAKLTPQNWPIVERMANWHSAWNMYEDNPLFGVGIGNYPEAYEHYFVKGWREAKGHAHNVYLNMLAEMGIIGLGSYLVLVATFFVYGFRILRRFPGSARRLLSAAVTDPSREDSTVLRYLLIGLLGSLIAVSFHNLLDNLYVHGIGVQIGMILGLITVLERLGRVTASPRSQSLKSQGGA
jgi:O-antigen ligase